MLFIIFKSNHIADGNFNNVQYVMPLTMKNLI